MYTSQMISQFHRLAYFMGNTKLPFVNELNSAADDLVQQPT